MKGNSTAGHLASLLTIIIWEMTFISTKILLADFQPAEILFFRFLIGLLALLLFSPRRLRGTNRRQELTFAAAGLFLSESKLFLRKEEKQNGLAK